VLVAQVLHHLLLELLSLGLVVVVVVVMFMAVLVLLVEVVVEVLVDIHQQVLMAQQTLAVVVVEHPTLRHLLLVVLAVRG
jgi:hypothetical protein